MMFTHLARALVAGALAIAVMGPLYGSDAAASEDGWEIVLEWGEFGTGPGQFNAPRDLAVGPDGHVYVADRDNERVQVFDRSGNYLRDWFAGRVKGIDIDEQGVVYTVAVQGCVVQQHSSTGEFLGDWGSCSGPGSLQGARDVGLSGGFAFVNANTLKKFTASGDFVATVDVNGAWALSVAPDGTVWSLHSFDQRVRQYDLGGLLLREWTLPPSEDYQTPLAIAVGEGGSVYITVFTDSGLSMLQEYNLDGVLQSTTTYSLGELGALVAVDANTLLVVSTSSDSILKLVRKAVPVETATWGQIKARYGGAEPPDTR